METLHVRNDRRLRARVAALAILIGLMWLVHGIDCAFLHCHAASGFGVVPRTTDGLVGIITAPFVHANTEHLVSNTVPLAVLGAIVLVKGVNEFLLVLQFSMLGAGLGSWLFGTPQSEHIGASGIVMGFFGYLLFRTAFERSWLNAVITIVITGLYGLTVVYAFVPHQYVSWTSHVFGFIGGFLAARFRYRRRLAPVTPLIEFTTRR